MNRLLIRVIKQKNAEVTANVETQITRETKSAAAFSEEQTERLLQRTTAETVSNWISEHRKNNRVKGVSAIGSMFGSKSLLNKTA